MSLTVSKKECQIMSRVSGSTNPAAGKRNPNEKQNPGAIIGAGVFAFTGFLKAFKSWQLDVFRCEKGQQCLQLRFI